MKKSASSKTQREATDSAPSVQDRCLTQWAEAHTRVAVFLVNGVRVEGEIISFDQYVILVKGEMIDQIYKHAVSTIQPVAPARPEVDISVKRRRLAPRQ
jgi:host factor-I protein